MLCTDSSDLVCETEDNIPKVVALAADNLNKNVLRGSWISIARFSDAAEVLSDSESVIVDARNQFRSYGDASNLSQA